MLTRGTATHRVSKSQACERCGVPSESECHGGNSAGPRPSPDSSTAVRSRYMARLLDATVASVDAHTAHCQARTAQWAARSGSVRRLRTSGLILHRYRLARAMRSSLSSICDCCLSANTTVSLRALVQRDSPSGRYPVSAVGEACEEVYQTRHTFCCCIRPERCRAHSSTDSSIAVVCNNTCGFSSSTARQCTARSPNSANCFVPG